MTDLQQILKDVEDHLARKLALDPIERTVYYHLLRHTHVIGKESALFGLLSLAKAVGISEDASRTRIRALHEKGCIIIQDRSNNGHLIRVVLPAEIEGLIPRHSDVTIPDLKKIDFFSNRTYVSALLARENSRCFYCLKEVEESTCVLDHVLPQMSGPDNSYRNIVIACHACNADKQAELASDFIRSLYRKGVMSQPELQDRLAMVERLQNGELVPQL